MAVMVNINGGYVPSLTLKLFSTQKTDANAIRGIKVNDAAKGDGKALVYDADANELVFQAVSGNGESFDQDLNTDDDVEFNNVTVNNLTVNGTATGDFGNGGGDSFDQDLNTTNNVQFAGIVLGEEGVISWDLPNVSPSYQRFIGAGDNEELIVNSETGINLVVNGTTAVEMQADLAIRFHENTGIGFFGVAPVGQQLAITFEDGSTLTTDDAAIIENMRTRIRELEQAFIAYGLLPEIINEG